MSLLDNVQLADLWLLGLIFLSCFCLAGVGTSGLCGTLEGVVICFYHGVSLRVFVRFPCSSIMFNFSSTMVIMDDFP